MNRFIVEFYQTEQGEEPAKEFLLQLNRRMRAKMMHVIVLLQDNGNELREPFQNTCQKASLSFGPK